LVFLFLLFFALGFITLFPSPSSLSDQHLPGLAHEDSTAPGI